MKHIAAVTGEGPTDYGCEWYNKKTGQNEWQWGPVKILLERCFEQTDLSADVEYRPIQKQDIKRMKLLRSEKILSGRAIPARKFRNICREQGIANGVFYTDADKGDDSGKSLHSARRHFEDIYEEVSDGLEKDVSKSAWIPMIPMKMIFGNCMEIY